MKIIANISQKIKNDEILNRAAQALSFSFIGAVFSKICIMIMNILLSRILGKEDYGKYSLINSTIETFVTFASMGIGASLVRYTSLYKKNKKELCGKTIGTLLFFCICMCVVIAFVVWGVSKEISLWVTKTEELQQLFKLASLIIFFIALSSMFQSILQGFEKFKMTAFNEILYGIFSVIVVSIISLKLGLVGGVVGILISRIFICILMGKSAAGVSKQYGIEWSVKVDRHVWSIFSRFTIPSFFASIFVIPVSWFLNAQLVRNTGYGEMAVYAVAMQWIAIITYITALFTRVKPIYVELLAENKIGDFKKILYKMIGLSTALGSVIAFIGIVFSKFLMSLYGKEYVQSVNVFIVMMIAGIFITLQSQFGSVFEAMGKMWLGLILNIIWAINLILFFEIFMEKGAYGYSIAYLISYAIHCLLSWCVCSICLMKWKQL